MDNDLDERPTAAIIVNKVAYWLDEISQDDDDVDGLYEYNRASEFVTKDLEIETIPRRGSVMRVKEKGIVHLSPDESDTQITTDITSLTFQKTTQEWTSGNNDIDNWTVMKFQQPDEMMHYADDIKCANSNTYNTSKEWCQIWDAQKAIQGRTSGNNNADDRIGGFQLETILYISVIE
ncbi:hypothetical protein C2G38_2198589 [Gigaspora rosea]|uniref:Uncharacterized protein n=1 Tax=Gigaspora rosea TaxID=44941 RepID=A0A397USH2_9GLOM|nr:hypothetical protein C2G38_2198589 [Gigaspora rosea]